MLAQRLNTATNKRTILKHLLLVGVFLGVLFAILNIMVGDYLLSAVEFTCSALSLGLFVAAHKTRCPKRIQLMALVFTCVAFTVILFAIVQKTQEPSVVSWLFIAPVLAYLLLGKRVGIVVIGVFAALFVIIYAYHSFHLSFSGSRNASANLLMSFLSVWFLSHIYEQSNEKNQRILKNIATRDQLTGLLNRTTLTDVFERNRSKGDISLVVLDIDLFKSINDRFGHEAGDKALELISQTLREHVRSSDYVFRLGGEEFCIILPNCSHDRAYQIIENIRIILNRTKYDLGGEFVNLSFSAGVASCSSIDSTDQNTHTLSDMLRIADARMYEAKTQGRNMVVAQTHTST